MKTNTLEYISGFALVVSSLKLSTNSESLKSRIAILKEQQKTTSEQLIPIGGISGLCLPQPEIKKLTETGKRQSEL